MTTVETTPDDRDLPFDLRDAIDAAKAAQDEVDHWQRAIDGTDRKLEKWRRQVEQIEADRAHAVEQLEAAQTVLEERDAFLEALRAEYEEALGAEHEGEGGE
jgi:chromosome segregation ATPase